MAILITGGTGFIGSRLVEQSKKNGNKVILFTGDISKREDTQNFYSDEKIDILIHLAAVVSHRDRDFLEKVNIDGTKNVVEMGHRLQVRRLIFLSSIRCLSNSSDPYINSKRVAEKDVVSSGLPYIVLRPSMVYGPGDNKNIGFLIKLAKVTPIMPILNFRIQPIFVDDVVKAISGCLNLPANQVINMVGPEIISFEKIPRYLKDFGYKFLKVKVPSFFSFLVWAISFLPFSPVTPWQIKTLLADEVYKGDDWQKLLSLEVTPFVEGLRKTLI